MNFAQILPAMLAHLQITFFGVLAGCLVGIPLGSIIVRMPRTAKIVFFVVDVIQTVPTLAMFTFLMLAFGLHNNTVIITIFLYTLFPVVRNTYTGIRHVDPGIVRAGRGIGMTELQLYRMVQMPIAMPVVISGVRLALITALGIATTGVLIGASGLGMLVWRGIQTRNAAMMLSGAIPVSLLAVVFDILLSQIERKLGKKIQ